MRLRNYSAGFVWGLGFCLLVLLNVSCEKKAVTDSYFPEVGDDALYRRAIELRSNLNVLSIALEPGHEDLAGLAYFRIGKGANIVSAYLTNGEAGESDVRADYPN